jgi:hypothetical protein
MSAIAQFIRIPIATLEQLRTDFDGTLQHHGVPAANYEWSGSVLATLLSFLDDQGIRLMDLPYDALTPHLSQARGATIFIFTSVHKDAYLSRLSPERFSSEALRDYYNEFNDAHEAEIGEAMLDGIGSIHDALASLDKDSVIVLSIG